MQFINSSLASLIKNLGDNHLITSQYFKKLGYTEEQLALVYRKGVYFYDYINSYDRFQETEFPPIYEFYSTLKEFRKISMEYYELDPSHYVSAPSLSWDGMLKMSGVRIELFTDMAMHDFIEKAKRS
ncbi:11433_t:CDS:2, partial [Funneliformis geosporum]